MAGNRDKCGRCETRHGGNNHGCPVHGAVSDGCCEPICDKKDWIVIKDKYTNGNIKGMEIVSVHTDLTNYKREGEAWGLPMNIRYWERAVDAHFGGTDVPVKQ